ncbi:MAG: YkgJ family cysteine cluster protein [Candidatus Heimdallarchaeota archaeon]|nr:YkgJ family cysteine cluster protein [Candidatus Heimdallarchaeota archaeon]
MDTIHLNEVDLSVKLMYNDSEDQIMRVDLPVVDAEMIIGEINLNTKNINLEGSTPLKFSCASTADCCSNLKIPVTDFDIKRIEDHGYAIDQIVESLSPQLRLPKTEFGNIERNYWMKSNPFTATCTFLEDNLCKIHDFKPFGCRVFPFSLKHMDTERVIVKIHPSNLCKTISICTPEEADNETHLNKLLTVILEEEAFRDWYFEKYGNAL